MVRVPIHTRVKYVKKHFKCLCLCTHKYRVVRGWLTICMRAHTYTIASRRRARGNTPACAICKLTTLYNVWIMFMIFQGVQYDEHVCTMLLTVKRMRNTICICRYAMHKIENMKTCANTVDVMLVTTTYIKMVRTRSRTRTRIKVVRTRVMLVLSSLSYCTWVLLYVVIELTETCEVM